MVAIPGYLTGGSGAVIAASGGLTFGAFTIASVGARPALPRLLIGALAGLAVVQSGVPWLTATILIGLAGCAGLEVARYGTRCLVAAVFGCLAMIVGTAKDPGIAVSASFLAGLIAGCGSMWVAGLIGVIPPSAKGRAIGVGMVLFLTLGLIASTILAWEIGGPRSYWVAFLFVMRAIVPLEAQKDTIARFGIGASIGVLLAVLIELANPIVPVQLILALLAGLIGLRYITHPLPVSSAAFSAAILLGAAPTLSEAASRAQAILIVFLLVLFLVFVLDLLWRSLSRRLA